MFPCDTWLSVDKPGQRLRRSLNVAHCLISHDTSQLVRKNASRHFFDHHIWLSVGYRANKSMFTRAQRLGVCLATLFLTMIANAMFYQDASDSQSTSAPLFSLGPISITGTHLFNSLMSSIIIFVPLLAIAMLFSRSSPKKNINAEETGAINEETQASALGRKNGMLPYWCAYIAWALVALSVVVATFFTILYAVQWGRKESTDWLIAFLLSFIESVILIQPVQVRHTLYFMLH